ncbi:MAG: tyrosine-type recombinase/integrase [Clostridiales bacterium]|nr:tyrosine-type recombinase/integrase [Clostridiales bacterium]
MSALRYSQLRDQEHLLFIRDALKRLPDSCAGFIRAIEPTTTCLTRSAYVRDLTLFFRFLTAEIPRFGGLDPAAFTDADLDAVTADHIARFIEYLSLYLRLDQSIETNGQLGKMRKLSTLRSYFDYMFKNSKISKNTAQLISLPKLHEKPILRLELDEMARMLDAADDGQALTDRQQAWHARTRERDLAMLTLFLGTGIRVSECVGLDIEDLDFEINGFLVSRKGGNQSILYFPDEVASTLRQYLAVREAIEPLPGHERALFLSLQRRRMTVRAVENMVKKYAAVAAPLKKRLSPHKLRSTFGTNLYRETGDIYLVADVLGHSDVNTTRKHYAAMSDDLKRRAAQSVRLRDEAPKPPDGGR